MGFREVTMLEIKEVLRRWLRGDSKSEIAGQERETCWIETAPSGAIGQVLS